MAVLVIIVILNGFISIPLGVNAVKTAIWQILAKIIQVFENSCFAGSIAPLIDVQSTRISVIQLNSIHVLE